MILKINEISEIFSVNEDTIENWVERGCPVNDNGKFDLGEFITWWAENIFEGGSYGGSLNNDDDIKAAKLSYLKAQAREKNLKADMLEGTLIAVDEVHKRWAWRLKEVSAALLSISLKLATMCAMKPELEVRKVIENEIWKILDTFSRTGKFCELKSDEIEKKTKKKKQPIKKAKKKSVRVVGSRKTGNAPPRKGHGN